MGDDLFFFELFELSMLGISNNDMQSEANPFTYNGRKNYITHFQCRNIYNNNALNY